MSTLHPNADAELGATRQRRRVATRRPAHFRLASVTAVGTIGLLILGGLSASAVAALNKPTKPEVIETATGARISLQGASFESVYKVVSPLNGTGAAIQEGAFLTTTFPVAGKDTFTDYFANGVLRTENVFELGAPDASGIGKLTGSGKCVGGTGVHRHEHCAYTFTGTYDDTTTLTKLTSIGTDTR